MWILGMMGEIRHAIGEASGYGKAGGDDFSGLFRFICKIANLCSRLHCGGKVYFLAPLPLGFTWEPGTHVFLCSFLTVSFCHS